MLWKSAPGSFFVATEGVVPSDQLYVYPFRHMHPSRMLSEDVPPVEYCTFGYGFTTRASTVDDLRAFTLLANPVMQ